MTAASSTMFFRNTVWSFGAQIVRLLTALLLIALLEPAARGVQSLLVLLPTLVATLAMLGVASAVPVVAHRGHADKSIDERRLFANLLGLAFVVLALLLLILLPLTPLAARFLSAEYVVRPSDVLIGLLLLPPTLVGEYLRSLLAARRDLRQIALIQMLQAIVQLVLALVLVLVLRMGALGAVWATVISAWLGLIHTVRSLRTIGTFRPRLDRAVLSPLLSLGLRGHAGNVVQTLNYRLDALLLQGFLGQTAVGLYQTGVVLAELIWYLPNAVSAALLPQVAANQQRPPTPLLVRHTLMLTTLGSLLMLAAVWPALALLRPAYLGAIPPMAILLLGVIALSVHKVLASDLSGRALPQYPSRTSLLALVVTLVGDLLLIPRYGIVGAAMASSLAYCVQTIALISIYRRLEQVSWQELLVFKADDLLVYRRLVLRGTGAQH